MRNSVPRADRHNPNCEDIVALPHLVWERAARVEDHNAEYWIQAETQLQAKRLAELRQEAITECEQRNLDRLWVMRAISRG